MNKILLLVFSIFLISCNHIERGEELNKEDITRIQKLNLLESDEKILKFYSEFKKKVAGNFFTNKRVAKYWIDEHNKTKTEISSAYYSDIKSIDTVYFAGATYSPYMLVTKNDGSRFKVCANGKKSEIKLFFEEAIYQWQLSKMRK